MGGLIWACGTTTAIYTSGASVDRWPKETSWIGLAVASGLGIAVSMAFRRWLAEAVAPHACHRAVP